MAKGFSLADRLFNAETVAGLGARIAAVAPGFDAGAFTAQVMARLGDLELKARIGWIAECLDTRLPGDFEALAAVIEASLPPPLDPTLEDGDFGDFIHAPLGEPGGAAGDGAARPGARCARGGDAAVLDGICDPSVPERA